MSTHAAQPARLNQTAPSAVDSGDDNDGKGMNTSTANTVNPSENPFDNARRW